MNNLCDFANCKEQARNAETLNDLFDSWKCAHSVEDVWENTTTNGIEKKSFVEDGYINEKLFNSAETKILFILKEANIQRNKNNTVPEERNQYCFYRNFAIVDNHFVNTNVPKQHEKMGRMAVYLSENNCNIRKQPSLEMIHKALSASAFMNLNKRGGSNKASKAAFAAYVEKYRNFILSEVRIINPDVVVILGSDSCMKKLSADIKKVLPNAICINHWHTAYRMPRYQCSDNLEYGDKNIEKYMSKFFEVAPSETLTKP